MSGPAPTPVAVQLVHSGGKLRAYAKRRAEHEAQVLDALGDPPPDFTEAQRAAWVQISKLAPVNLLTSADRELFAGFVVTAALRAETLQLFNRMGGHVLVRDKVHDQLVLNPLMREYRRMTEQLRALGSELGFSPAARTRMAAMLAGGNGGGGGGGEGDELMRFLSQGRG